VLTVKIIAKTSADIFEFRCLLADAVEKLSAAR
jgi:hypothetical protein